MTEAADDVAQVSDEDKTADSMSLNSPFHLIQQSFLLNEILSLSFDHIISEVITLLGFNSCSENYYIIGCYKAVNKTWKTVV